MKRLMLKTLVAACAVAAFGVANAQEKVIKFGLNGPEGHPAVAGMKKFADAVAAKSGGKMKVNLFLNGSLGSDQSIVSAIKGGTVEMSVMNSGILASEAKELSIFDFPFLFANEKESDAIVDGFTDSDFGGGGTNLQGYTIGGQLALSPHVWLTLRWLSANAIAGPTYKNDIIQFDLNAKF